MLTALLVFLLVLIALLAIPITVLFQLSWPDDRENDVQLHWGFGLVRAQLPTGQAESEPMDQNTADPRETARKQPRGATPKVWAAIRQPAFRRRVLRFAGDVWAAIHKHDVRLRVRIGLDDPADTGKLWAVLGPVSGVLASARTVAIVVEPEFQDEMLALASRGRIRIVPLQLLYLAVALCLSPSIWRGVRAMRPAPG